MGKIIPVIGKGEAVKLSAIAATLVWITGAV
jgi:hypothetical protein